ncbi:MAG: Chloroplast import component protein (Tic20) [Acidobacteria bacterium OLB17]|nr:MAG: Chloroplast import component protein (Tic20) [Acidobacteria bacterium OLB17]
MSAGKTALGLDNNVGALICYVGNVVCALGLIYSIVVMVTDKTNKLPRFHAMQSILLSAASIVLYIVGVILIMVIAMLSAATGSSAIGLLSFLVWLVMIVLGLGLFVFMIIAAIKAFQGEIYKIPVIGNFAEKFSS